MILILGSNGYVGKAFLKYFNKCKIEYKKITLNDFDYTKFTNLMTLLANIKPRFVINCAGYTGKPNVDGCEKMKSETIVGNITFPLNLANACHLNSIPLGHVSSGCIYNGGKMMIDGKIVTINDFTDNKYVTYDKVNNNSIIGFREEDPPNFNFEENNSSLYSGTKALLEKILNEYENIYLWRLRIPFNNTNNPRNYLTKLMTYPKIYDNLNSITHLDEFVEACLKCHFDKVPFGTYNIVNTKPIKTRRVIEIIKNILSPNKTFIYWKSNEEFYSKAASTARSNCVLDNSKILKHGITMRDSENAITESLQSWRHTNV